MVVLSWLVGNPKRFKTYVGNRISHIVELIPPDRWNHVSGIENPADCASRGLFPSELLDHKLWWNGPTWLKSTPHYWPRQSNIPPTESSEEVRQICHHIGIGQSAPLIPFDRYSSFNHLKRVTAWIFRFIDNCHRRQRREGISPHLTTEELAKARNYWISLSQRDHFCLEIESLKNDSITPESSSLFVLHPFMDSSGLVRVGGRVRNARISYDSRHPIILHGKHPITKLIISSEHTRLLHAGPTLVMASLCRHYHIVGCRKAIPSITRKCIICRRTTVKPQSQLLGQLPSERVSVFDNGSLLHQVWICPQANYH